MYLSGGTHTAHFNLGLMDETTTPNRVIALIYSGGPGENIQQALDSASADWISLMTNMTFRTVRLKSR